MKLHLPLSLLHAVLCAVCSFSFGITTLIGGILMLGTPCAMAESYTYGDTSLDTQQTQFVYTGYSRLTFADVVTLVSTSNGYGGVLGASSSSAQILITNNGPVRFLSNSISAVSYAYGGAIAVSDNRVPLTLDSNSSLTFVSNTASAKNAFGGAIGSSYVGSFSISSNVGGVEFRGNVAESTGGSDGALGGAICGKTNIRISGAMCHNGDVLFSENRAVSTTKSYGGAIFCNFSMEMEDNGLVTFSHNTAQGTDVFGGALYESGSFIFSGNDGIVFNSNKAAASGNAKGGAIYYQTGDMTFDGGVGCIAFSQNVAESQTNEAFGGAIYSHVRNLYLSSEKAILFEGNSALSQAGESRGGAIYMESTNNVSLSGKGTIDFRNNIAQGVASANGGAVCAGVILASEIGDITFSGNRVSSETGNALGGALKASTQICDSGNVLFSENEAISEGGEASGGAIYYKIRYSDKELLFWEDNGIVRMEGNAAHGTILAQGGAIYQHNKLSMKGNAEISFIGNVATSHATAQGGAVSSPASGSDLIVQGTKGEVRFKDNMAVSQNGTAKGGAIYNPWGSLVFRDNGDISFIGNAVVGQTNTVGGAIFNDAADFSFVNNGNVTFRRNYEKQGDDYRLRSIYSENKVALSASDGKSITFYDSLYSADAMTLNSSYTGTDSQTYQSTGSIVFSGKYTEDDLRKIKGDVAGTFEEILTSRTSTINGALTLNNGRLLVEEHALLESGYFTAKTGATMEISNASLVTTSAQYSSSLTDCSLVLTNGGALKLKGMLTLSGTVTLSLSGFSDGEYKLISATSVRGAENLAIRIAEADKEKYTVAWNEQKNELTLTVLGVKPILPPREESITHTWTQLKGVLGNGTELGEETFQDGDSLEIGGNAAITVSGTVKPAEIVVNSNGKVTITSDKKVPESGISGEGSLTKSGAGMLTMNAGNTYTGGTVLNAGTIKATAVDSFGTGAITVKGGTLDLGSKAVANDIVLAGSVTLKGDAKYAGAVTVEGNATLLAKASYKTQTTIGAGSTLTLAEKVTMAGNLVVDGTLRIRDAKGLTLAKNQTLTLGNGGSVSGLVTIGSGSTLVWGEGGMSQSPVLKGGTLDLGAENSLTLTGSKAQVQFGDKRVDLPGKGIVYTDETLTVNSGTVTLNAVSGYEGEMAVNGGTLKLATGKQMTDNAITVSGNAAVVNGKLHSGDITVNGTLAKGTNITVAEGRTVALNGAGAMLGTIAGAGTVDVNASIDATAAKITAAHINLNSGTFTNTKGIKLAKGQTLSLGGVTLNLGTKGALATAAGSTLVVSGANTLSGSLTLGGGELVLAGGSLDVNGTLTLSKAVTVTGSGVITYTALKPFKGDISVLFGRAEVVQEDNTLTITGAEPLALRTAPAPLDAAPAPPALTPAPNPVADAMVQADWGILDANRAFMGAVNSRHQHAALLDKGRGAAWVSAFGASVRHGNQGTHHGSDGTLSGAAFGLEHAVSETASLGLAVGRSKNRLAATGVTHLRQETAHVALYGQKQLAHGFTADATAAYGDTETKLGAASWTQKSAALAARLTHAQQLTDATAFRTFGGFSYEATEAGSIGSAHTGSVQNLRAELGAGVTHTAGKAHFYAEAALTGDLIRHNPTADVDGTRTHGANPGRIGIRATVGGLYEFTDTWSGTASYSVETESRSTSHTLNIGASKSF